MNYKKFEYYFNEIKDAIDDECHWLSYYFYESDEEPFTCEIDGSALSLWSLIKD